MDTNPLVQELVSDDDEAEKEPPVKLSALDELKPLMEAQGHPLSWRLLWGEASASLDTPISRPERLPNSKIYTQQLQINNSSRGGLQANL